MAARSRLSTEALSHYRTFGYAVLEGYLDGDDVEVLDREVEAGMAEAYRHNPFDGSKPQWLPLLGHSALLTDLAEGELADTARELYDDGVVLWMADTNRYVGDTPWHVDVGWDADPRRALPASQVGGVKFALYLEPLSHDSGALRVIPGSHLDPLHTSVGEHAARFAAGDAPALPYSTCVTEPGDIVAFDWRIWHASVGGASGRRLCTVDYLRRPVDAVQATAACEKAASVYEHSRQNHRRHGYDYFDERWLANPANDPRRARLIADMSSIGLIAACGAADR